MLAEAALSVAELIERADGSAVAVEVIVAAEAEFAAAIIACRHW